MSWDKIKEQKLRDAWNKGLTASQIAALIPGTTRNSIIGKAHRLKLEARAKSKKTPNLSKQKTQDNSRPKQEKVGGRRSKFKALLLDKSFPPENPTKLLDLTDEHCKYPLGEKMEPANFFCGRKPVNKFPYCELHLLYSYVSKSDKEEDQIQEEDLPKFIENKIKSA